MSLEFFGVKQVGGEVPGDLPIISNPMMQTVSLRILVVSGFYPPHYIGGYEIGCRDAVEALKSRGHQVKVLTSDYGVDGRADDEGVCRDLRLTWDPGTLTIRGGGSNSKRFLFQLAVEKHNREMIGRACRDFKPDVVYFWQLNFISISLVFVVQRLDLPIVYFVFDNWLAQWRRDAWYSQGYYEAKNVYQHLGRRLLRIAVYVSGLLPTPTAKDYSIDLRHVQFATNYLKRHAMKEDLQVADAEIIHWGLKLDDYRYREQSRPPRRLLYVGQIVHTKGVHTAVEALKALCDQLGNDAPLTLTIVGGAVNPKYQQQVDRLAQDLGLQQKVTFTGPLARESLQSVYQEHDILIFPSLWEEPFGITILEAMASGLAVVATGTGGSREILQDDENCLLFTKEDGNDCARQLSRLLHEENLLERIRANGRTTVEQRFNFQTTIDKIEDSLRRAVA